MTLDLKGNEIGDEGALCFGEVLRQNMANNSYSSHCNLHILCKDTDSSESCREFHQFTRNSIYCRWFKRKSSSNHICN